MNIHEDWRLQSQINYLFQVKLKKSHFKPTEKWNHEHCSFCWETFDTNHSTGYCTLDAYYWVCEPCYQDFKEMFQWELVELQSPDES
jgi:hypothetical protein